MLAVLLSVVASGEIKPVFVSIVWSADDAGSPAFRYRIR